MIPKIIHYCWFGSEVPAKIKNRVKEWKRILPDYKFVLWNEKSFDIEKHEFTKYMYDSGRYAFVADYVRLFAVLKNGGIYLDTDVLLIKSFNSLLQNKCFFALEDFDSINTGLGFGAEKSNPIIQDLMDIYDLKTSYLKRKDLLSFPTTVEIVSNYFRRLGFKNKNKNQRISDTLILNSYYLAPQKVGQKKAHLRKYTIGIHEYDGSWTKQSRYKLLLKRYFRTVFVKIFGSLKYQSFRNMIRKNNG